MTVFRMPKLRGIACPSLTQVKGYAPVWTGAPGAWCSASFPPCRLSIEEAGTAAGLRPGFR